jgi:hypothetical protein
VWTEQQEKKMGTTSYFEETLSMAGKDGNADPTAPETIVEVLVSSFSGKHQLYIRTTNADGDEYTHVLDKDQAIKLLEGLDKAAFYLGYIKR